MERLDVDQLITSGNLNNLESTLLHFYPIPHALVSHGMMAIGSNKSFFMLQTQNVRIYQVMLRTIPLHFINPCSEL